MFLHKETLPNEVDPISKWVPRQGTMLSKNMDMDNGNNKNQCGAYAMSVLEMLLCGGAAGMDTSGRSLVGLQMQVHEGGPNLLKVKRLSDMLEIERKGAFSPGIGADWWSRVQMAFTCNKEGKSGINKILSRKAMPMG